MGPVTYLHVADRDDATAPGVGAVPPNLGAWCPAARLQVNCTDWPHLCHGGEHGSTTPCDRTLGSGQHLFLAGDPATAIYLIYRGALKTYRITDDGNERVTGFYFEGDMAGWSALVCGHHPCHAMALEPTQIKRLPSSAVLSAALHSQHGQAQMLDGIRGELLLREALFTLEHRKAEERLAAFLLWLADSQLSGDGGLIHLPMSRSDIGSYLGLAFETVSRRLALFQDKGWISLRRRRIRIIDANGLRQLATPLPHTLRGRRSPAQIDTGQNQSRPSAVA